MVRVLTPGGYFYSDVVPKKLSLFRLSSIGKSLRVGGEEMFEGAYDSGDIHQWLTGTASLEKIRIIGAGVLPPYRLTHRPPWMRDLVFKLKPLWNFLEGGWLGRFLGFYYFVTARKKIQ